MKKKILIAVGLGLIFYGATILKKHTIKEDLGSRVYLEYAPDGEREIHGFECVEEEFCEE